MTTETILKHFEIQRNQPKTLTAQLTEQIAAFIEEMPDNSRMPSERELAETLQVTRVTVQNALKPFLESGTLISRKRHGIFTVKSTRGLELDSIHPAYLEHFFIGHPVANLRIILNESLEPLQKFWREAIEEFNRERQNVRVEIEWQPYNIVTDREFWAYAEQEGIDMVQRHPSMVHTGYEHLMNLNGLLEPLPAEDDEMPDCFNVPNREQILAPIYFCLWNAMWNETLGREYGLGDIETEMASGYSDDVLLKAGKLLPSTMSLAGNIWNYFLLPGVPLKKEEFTVEFFRGRFERLEKLLKYPNMFIRRQVHPLEALYTLAEGTGMFYFGLAHFMLVSQSLGKYDFRTALFPHQPGLSLPWVSNNLGIMKNSRNPEAAIELIRHMQSPEIQRKLITITGLCSPRRSVNELQRARMKPQAAENHRQYLKNLACMGDSINIILGSQKYCNEIFYDFMERRSTPAVAAEKIYKKLIINKI